MTLIDRKRVGGPARFLIAALFGAVLLLAPSSAYAADAPSVAYDGTARQLTVSGVEAPSGVVDLFPAFKDLMPGDTREQPIKVEAKGVQDQVSIFVRAVVDEGTASALEPISLTAAVSTGPPQVCWERERLPACSPKPRRSPRSLLMETLRLTCG